MATITKDDFSASTNGKMIAVVQTATAGTLIHTAVAGTTNWDEIWLYANNIDGTDRKLTIEWGDATVIGGSIEYTVAAEAGLALVIPGLLLQNGLTVKAFAATTNVINISGYVNKITA
jgi:hypothetical protein